MNFNLNEKIGEITNKWCDGCHRVNECIKKHKDGTIETCNAVVEISNLVETFIDRGIKDLGSGLVSKKKRENIRRYYEV